MIRLSNLKDTTPYNTKQKMTQIKIWVIKDMLQKNFIWVIFRSIFFFCNFASSYLQNKCVELCHIDMTTYIWTV